MGSKGEAVTTSRATVATYLDATGTLQTCPAGNLRVQGYPTVGAMIERAAVEYALNTTTHPKTTEATASLPTGGYVAWIEGTGALTVANGTATTTGLSCSAQPSSATCSFTVTGSGTMLVTTTAGTTRVQVTSGATRTSVIDATDASASRAADVVYVLTPAKFSRAHWCMFATFAPQYPWNTALPAGGYRLLELGSDGGANTARLWLHDGPNFAFDVFDTAGTLKRDAPVHGWTTTAAHRIGVCANGSGTLRTYADGAPLADVLSGSGTGILSATSSPLYLGSPNDGTYAFGGVVSGLVICDIDRLTGDCR
jgi:hypothetical protein